MSDDAQPKVMLKGAHKMVVCVPDRWDDEQIKSFASRENPLSGFWQISTPEQFDTERVPCVERDGYVHVVLDG